MSTPSIPPGASTGGPVGPDHTHPAPMSLRIIVFVVAIGFALAGVSVVKAFVDERAGDARLEAAIQTELDRRTADRDRREAASRREQAGKDERTRRSICTLLADAFEPSRAVMDVAVQLG